MHQFISHPFLKENVIEKRLYQEVLAARTIENGNTLIVAPTALGKTAIAALVSAFKLKENENQKILFLSPTKPLAAQHHESFKKFFKIDEEKINLLTGTIASEKRNELWNKSSIVSATPQTIESELLSNKLKLNETSLIIFDEAHKATGDYSYVFIAKKFIKENPNGLILGLTASPGSEEEKINDVCRNLFIKNIEIKTREDEDVKPYIKEIEIDWVKVQLPKEFIEIKKHLDKFIKEQIEFLKKLGYGRGINLNYYKKKDLLLLQSHIRKDLIANAKKNPSLYTAVSKIAALLKVSHAKILIETQGIEALHEYFERMKEKSKQSGATKALKMLFQNEDIEFAFNLTKQSFEKKILHPKMTKLAEILVNRFSLNPESKVLVFNHYRDSITNLEKFLSEFKEIRAAKFIGQATKDKNKGMTQKEQIQRINEFKEGKFNALLCSSVAEEGLDIPQVDLVVFFEPVPSEIRSIQRTGRTGRFEKGKVIILIAKETMDEGFYWASIAKEKKMKSTLSKIKKNNDLALPKQTTLFKYGNENEKKILIYVDTREQSSNIVKLLSEKEALIQVKQLEVGDFILSDSIAVERKTIEDFLSSMIDGRLFNQLQRMAANFDQPLLLVEGEMQEIYSLRNIHKNAIIGALTSIALNYRIPILFTKNVEETAEFIYVIAKREQLGKEKDIRIRIGRKGLSLSEQQRFIVEGLPLIGPNLAKNLLKNFGSIKGIVDASEKDLQEIENLGPKKAKQIRKVLDSEYKEEES